MVNHSIKLHLVYTYTYLAFFNKMHFLEYVGRTPAGKDALAQLIADSTEKKFSFNSLFKGIWKKKQAQYTLDTWKWKCCVKDCQENHSTRIELNVSVK